MSIELGKKLIEERNFKDAEILFLELNKKKENFDSNYNLGKIYFELKNIEKSKLFYKKCISLNPNSINTYLNLAFMDQSTGDLEGALSNYFRVLEINNKIIRAYYGIYTLDPNLLKLDYLDIIREINNNTKSNILEKFLSDYLLSKYEKKSNNIKKEIYLLTRSHEACFEQRKNYNLQSQKYYESIITKFYDKINPINTKLKKGYFDNIVPIFIIGLPRSGSTLVEAIISSHEKKIPSFGESAFINISLIKQLPANIFSTFENLEKFNLKVDKFEEDIYKKYFQFSLIDKKTVNFIDKSLENFLNIEFILHVFPKAKFLHCNRNLKDSIVGIFQNLLPALSFTHRIKDIVNYIDNYLKILNYFKKKYPDLIMDISLEEITNNKEKVTKEIFRFCNLDWKPEVLEFYKRKDLDIRTTSNIQIRNKISKYNSEKYSKYYHIFDEFKNQFDWLK